MDLGLKGQRALVTGASKGLGRSIALTLAEEGMNVDITARSAADLESVRADILSRHNVDVRVFPLDLSRSASVAALVKVCGDNDVLVNNAGAIPRGFLHEVDEQQWRTAWDLKVFGTINMTRAFYATMKSRRRGVIINIIGMAGEWLDADYLCGSTGNAALIAFTKAVGGVSSRDGIRVVGINPGPFWTPRAEETMRKTARVRLGDEERYGEIVKSMKLPFDRFGTPEEIAGQAAFLASDRAGYISGEVVNIDGGHLYSQAMF